MKNNTARAIPGSTVSCSRYIFHALTRNFENQFNIFTFQLLSADCPSSSFGSKLSICWVTELLSSTSLNTSLETLLWLLSSKAGIPSYTEVKSQYSNQTDMIFQAANVTADAFKEIKLMMKPDITGLSSLQTRSIRLIVEFMSVSTSGGWRSDITTTLSKNQSFDLKVTWMELSCHILFKTTINYHSLSIKIVPARDESAPRAPVILINITSIMNPVK